MTRIKVDPSILSQQAGSIQQEAVGVERAGDGAYSAARGAPSYDGQFGPRVWGIGSEALSKSKQISGQMGGLSGKLSNKAAAFDHADQAGQIGLGGNSWYIWDDWQERRIRSISMVPDWAKDLDPALLLYLGLLIPGIFSPLFVMTFIWRDDILGLIGKTFPGIRLPWAKPIIGPVPAVPTQVSVKPTKEAVKKEWDGMTDEQRLEWLRNQHKEICKKEGIPPVNFVKEDLPDDKGDFRGQYRGNDIVIDIDDIRDKEPWEVQETMAHETRHHYQVYLCNHPDLASSRGITKITIKIWETNYFNR